MKLDATGNRVNIYNNLISIVNTIEYTLLPMLSGYNVTNKSFKRWNFQPEDHFTNLRMEVMKLIPKEKSLLRNINKFQHKIVNECNPSKGE